MSCEGRTWGRDGHALISVEEAIQFIDAEMHPRGDECIPLCEAAERFLAGVIRVDEDYPAFDKAMMDGFAVRSADCAESGASLTIHGTAAAGYWDEKSVGPGQAVRINTGAPVPTGADCVIPVEQAEVSGDGERVLLGVAGVIGQNISRRGSVRRKGEEILSHPIRMGPGQMAAAAAAGVEKVWVHERVGIGLVVTGDEIVPCGGSRGRGQIYESNGWMLATMFRRFGAEPSVPVIARDEETVLANCLQAAMQEPIVVVVGGMSMGTLDLAPKVLETLGVEWKYHGVDMRPGKPTAYGRGPNGQHVFGLPGNPGSAFVCGWLFVRAAIRGLLGDSVNHPPMMSVELAREMRPARDRRPAYIPARCWSNTEGRLLCEPVRWGGSGDPFGLAEANVLMHVPLPRKGMAQGSSVKVIWLDGLDWRDIARTAGVDQT